jgi:hypothetical protein
MQDALDSGTARIFQLMVKRARRGRVRLDWEGAARFAFGSSSQHSVWKARMAVKNLCDRGAVDHVEDDWFEVSDHNVGDFFPDALAAPPGYEGTVVTSGHGGIRSADFPEGAFGPDGKASAEVGVDIKAGEWVPEPSFFAPRPTKVTPRVRLAREVFPQVCRDSGIRCLPSEFRWTALARHIKKLEEEDGLSLEFIEQMIREFGRHPEWARTSASSAWVCFLKRRSQLIPIVASHQPDTPSWLGKASGNDHRADTEENARYWLGRAYQGAVT